MFSSLVSEVVEEEEEEEEGVTSVPMMVKVLNLKHRKLIKHDTVAALNWMTV